MRVGSSVCEGGGGKGGGGGGGGLKMPEEERYDLLYLGPRIV